jgi:ubiquinone/menaquinone biosynthesis C-methylase UbiE
MFYCKIGQRNLFMSNSRSFDRAAHVYDQTRLLNEPIAKYGIPAILDIIGSNAHLLEVGAGTGRISIPLLERGVDLIGCDLSTQMLARFQEKFSPAPIAQADAVFLPFASKQFTAVMTVHVLHLIPEWREALHEFKRVLVPGGIYLYVRTWAFAETSVAEQIRRFWRGWLAANSMEVVHPGTRNDADLFQELRSMGADITEVEAVRYPNIFNLREELERFESRLGSDTWDIPDALFESSLKELRAWMMHEYGDLDRRIEEEVRCIIYVARFAS